MRTPAFEEIDGLTVIEILYDQTILAVWIYVEVYFIDGDDICERKPFHIYEAVEYFKDMSVRSMKTAGNGGGRFRKTFGSKNDKYVRSVSDPTVLADEMEFLISLMTAVRLCTSPAVLL